MKLNTLFLMLVFMLALVSCSEESSSDIESEQKEPIDSMPPKSVEPQENRTVSYLTYKPTFYTEDKDHWIIVHNQDGELLDYRSFESGDELIFEALDSDLVTTDRLSVTILSYRPVTSNKHYVLETYTGIAKETVLERTGISGKIIPEVDNLQNFQDFRKTGRTTSEKATETYDITVNNIPNVAKYTLSSIDDGIIAENHKFQNASILGIGQVQLSSDIEYHLSIGDGDGGLKYYIIRPSESSIDINLDYSDFLEYDKIATVALPENQYYLTAWVFARKSSNMSEKPLFLTRDANAGPVKTEAKFGYLENYPHFDTFFWVKMLDGYGYGYQEIGEIPTTINVKPRPNFEILNPSINNFDFATDIEHLWRRSFWALWETIDVNESKNQTQWYVYSEGREKSKIGGLPAEIIEKYPELNIDDLYHVNTTLALKGKSYEGMLNGTFRGINYFESNYEWVEFFNPKE